MGARRRCSSHQSDPACRPALNRPVSHTVAFALRGLTDGDEDVGHIEGEDSVIRVPTRRIHIQSSRHLAARVDRQGERLHNSCGLTKFFAPPFSR